MLEGRRETDSPIIDVEQDEDEKSEQFSPRFSPRPAESFYSRLAALSALQSYYGYYQNPLTLVTQTAALQRALQTSNGGAQESPTRKRDYYESFSSPSSTTSSSCSTLSSPEKKLSPSVKIRRKKSSRKLAFDEDKSSPVSGTIIRQRAEGEEVPPIHKGDIDPEFNIVEVTDEAKAELAKIENKIGDFICRLCKEVYDDAFGLAQHRCNMIVHVEYRCPDCDKVFNCPANLASHRRWHKPKSILEDSIASPEPDRYSCEICHKKFKRLYSLKKHSTLHGHSYNPPSSPDPHLPPKHSIADLLGPRTENPFPCRFCELSFGTFEELTRHSSKSHYSSIFGNGPHLLTIAPITPSGLVRE